MSSQVAYLKGLEWVRKQHYLIYLQTWWYTFLLLISVFVSYKDSDSSGWLTQVELSKQMKQVRIAVKKDWRKNHQSFRLMLSSLVTQSMGCFGDAYHGDLISGVILQPAGMLYCWDMNRTCIHVRFYTGWSICNW